MYVCMHARMHSCMYVCTHARAHARTHARTHACTHAPRTGTRINRRSNPSTKANKTTSNLTTIRGSESTPVKSTPVDIVMFQTPQLPQCPHQTHISKVMYSAVCVTRQACMAHVEGTTLGVHSLTFLGAANTHPERATLVHALSTPLAHFQSFHFKSE